MYVAPRSCFTSFSLSLSLLRWVQPSLAVMCLWQLALLPFCIALRTSLFLFGTSEASIAHIERAENSSSTRNISIPGTTSPLFFRRSGKERQYMRYSVVRTRPSRSRRLRHCVLISFLALLLMMLSLSISFYNTRRSVDSLKMKLREDAAGNPLLREGAAQTAWSLLNTENGSLWGYVGGIDSLIEKRVDRAYWGPTMFRSNEGTVNESTVTNVVSERFRNLNMSEAEMKRRYKRHQLVKEVTGCDSLSVPFNPLHDSRCINFMTNSSNWLDVVPIGQNVDQRTIKFRLLFKPLRINASYSVEYPLETFVKVPQKYFVLEAASEVVAFNVDRLLLVNRVPPTGLGCLPLNTLRGSVNKYKHNTSTFKKFLQDSKAENYEQWIEKDLFHFLRRAKHHLRKNGNNQTCVLVSIQLKIADVVHFLETPMRIPYRVFSDTWFDYFDLRANVGELEDGLPTFAHERHYPGVLHLAALAMFDYVIGNMDRSPFKNNFVVGGVANQLVSDNTTLLHPNHPTFVYLDHGSSFRLRRPERNPIAKSHIGFENGKEDTFCLFRGPLLRRIQELTGPSGEVTHGNKAKEEAYGAAHNHRSTETLFTHMLRERVPPEVYSVIDSSNLDLVVVRMKELLAMAGRCLSDERIRRTVLFP
ncbi:hypothetical protein, conserved [Trypanosoma brucei brucei TREU927]|uniref:Uncharacterized protein n=1 Tax=Trypanosoma brucei brucei (strain 927/4 GUTat10.1) TaxID=185431 RepID=Q57V40_TRYB2|nr:hypothetical protein, conserved [Trypanosoma brucei brucei TREU927]AAX70529.1 hypothetical protein, conserved [Trypanosoma brucei]AAZ12235.1 hypothetical protein, conserved [Trypanosoma brucei brucei TREU927]